VTKFITNEGQRSKVVEQEIFLILRLRKGDGMQLSKAKIYRVSIDFIFHDSCEDSIYLQVNLSHI
jgi:hypothetical protein